MKWFHHDSAAHADPRMRALAATHGPAGIGVYWGILEQIAYHSDTFRLRVCGLSKEADVRFAGEWPQKVSSGSAFQGYPRQPEKIPEFHLKILAATLCIRRGRLHRIIKTCVKEGLFDEPSWARFAILFSPGLEQGADTYTHRRIKREKTSAATSESCANSIRTLFEPRDRSVRTLSDKVPPEQDKEEDGDKNKHPLAQTLHSLVQSLNLGDARRQVIESQRDSPFKPSADEFAEYCSKLKRIILEWNSSHEERLAWFPTTKELRTLFYGGTAAEKERITYESMNALDGMLSYPEVVLLAVRKMLDASRKTPIDRPMAWLWACLHGNGNGKGPWVHLTTAEEEIN